MRARRLVVLGMMTKVPVPGVIWQTIHYLLGFRRLGFDVYYVEAHACTPSQLMRSPSDDGTALAVALIDRVMRRFGLGDRWAFHALHDDGRCYGMSERALRRLLRDAELVINLHGATLPRPEHVRGDNLVYLETDPVRLQIELHDGNPASRAFLEQHSAFLTFAENLGRPGCDLPVPDEFAFAPTRQPVVLDLWENHGPDEPQLFTSVGNWHQAGRDVEYLGTSYGWSKDAQWRDFLSLPKRTEQSFELALSSAEQRSVEALEGLGWSVRPALDFGSNMAAYHSYVAGSRGEFTVAKEQNVRFRTGWFSDRSATYLAAGRPVVSQDTGFGDVLPVGEGLFAVSTLDDAIGAIAEINGDYARHRRAATEIAREYFDAERVLSDLLDHCGVGAAPARRSWPWRRPAALPKPADAAAEAEVVETETVPLPPLHPDSTVLAIIPHYQCEEWLEDCLSSLVAQTRPLDGIVVIDDASDEPPTAIVRRFPQVTLLHAERNVGPYRLVQQIIEETAYDGYLFQDADDWSSPARLETLLRHAAEAKAELIGTQEVRVFCDEPEVTPIEWPIDVNAQFAEKPTAFPLLHPTSLVSRDLVMRLGGFASGLRFSGDAEFLRRARFVTDVVNVPELLYFRRIRRGSLTTAPETGLQSPERKRVMEMLWQRARHNAELAALGGTPHLEPCETARPVGLRKLTGPSLLGRGSEQPPPRPEPPAVVPVDASGPPRPLFVVGADRSGVSALAWALGEHPALTAVPDGSWLGRLDEALGAAVAAADGGAPDAEAAAAFAVAAGRLAAGSAKRWVDGAWQHTYAIGVLAETFPEARFIHVVREVDSAVGVMTEPPLGAPGATGGTQVPARLRVALEEGEALAQWTAANRACLDAERRLGADRMLRVDFDDLISSPEQAVRAALEFAGEEHRDECLRPLRELRAREGHPSVPENDPLADERATARALCRELIGKPLPGPQRTLASSRQTTRDVLAEHLPAGSTVAIASRGDEDLIAAAGEHGRHFPADASGRWIGYHPRDDAAAIAQLHAAIRDGAEHVYFPWTALWWLEHYRELRRHLERSHRKLLEHPRYGALFELDARGINGATATRRRMPATPGRVVLVTDHFPKFSETFFAREYSELRERGWDMHVLCNRSNRDQWQYFPELREELESQERIHVISDFEAQLAELRPEVVHFGYGTLARGRMHVRDQLGCKIAVSLRGYDINYFGLDDPHCYDDVWAGVDMVHAVSEDVWRRAVRRGCPPTTPHRVITDAIDVAAFTAPDRRYEDAGSEQRPLRLVSVGRLHWKKGHEQALVALRMLLDRGIHARHCIIGDGPDREPILFAIHDLGLSDHVELMGARSSSEVQEALRRADVCVQASISEGFCVSVIEAQAMGLPVVCTDADGLSENVADGETGFVVGRRDGRAIGERLVELAGDRRLRERLGTAARARAERHFDIARQLDGLASMYRAIAAPDKPSAASRRVAADVPPVSELERELAALTARVGELDRMLQSRRAVEELVAEVDRLVPADARVLVISRGDEELLALGSREAWHFPRAADGRHVGVQPADSDSAIAALEGLRSGGADYLVIPAESAWWLDRYRGFAAHLDDRYTRLATGSEACAIYELRIRRPGPVRSGDVARQGLARA